MQNDARARDHKSPPRKAEKDKQRRVAGARKAEKSKNTGGRGECRERETEKALKEISGDGANMGHTAIDLLPRR